MKNCPTRKTRWLAGCALAAVAVLLGAGSAAADPLPEVQVYKSAACGCCEKWVEHLEANGFRVTATDVADLDAVKAELGVPSDLGACHTGVVGGYLVEGHVPAEDIKRLLLEQPTVSGISVPGMPHGSPGMESPHPERYQVIAFGPDGQVVFATHGPKRLD